MLRNEAVTIKRYGQTIYLKGHAVAGAETILLGDATIQPLNGKELLQLPEGDREKESVKIFTDTLELKNNDILICANNKSFELKEIKDWTAHIIPHYRAIGLRINV